MAGSSAKRKREYSEEEKLSHQANISFSRELKKIKTFEVQKVIKTLGKDPENPALQLQVELLKNLDISKVVRRALLSLGLEPSEKQLKNADLPSDLQAKIKEIETSFLKHKRLAPIMATWKKKTTEHADKLFKEENVRLNNTRQGRSALGARSGTAPESLFVGSLSGFDDPEDKSKEDDIAEFLGENKKKNRPGQRARKQKALMLEAIKSGKPLVGNGNYREKKQGPPKHKKPKQNDPKPSRSEAPKKPEKPKRPEQVVDKSSHPSWAAKQALKDKEKVDIHAFAGKKVVFDD